MLKRLLLSVMCVAVLGFGAVGIVADANPADAATKKKVSSTKIVKKAKVASKSSKTQTLRRAAAATAGSSAAYAAYNSSRYADLIIDAGTGKVLRETNADAPRHPASLTKMMTLYMIFAALESGKLRLHDELFVSPQAASAAPSKLGLRAGDRIEVEDVILGLVTRSANDASVVAAEALGNSEARFAGMMTQTAHKLGMTDTVYKNANGLPNSEQITTARDQAKLGLALQRHFPQYYPYFSRQSFVFRGQTITSHNRLLARYPGMDGMKTGFVNASGFNLVTSAKRGNKRLIGVIFGGTSAASRDNQMAKLMDASFDGTFQADRPKVQVASAVYKPEIAAPVVEQAAAVSARNEVTSMDEDFAENAPENTSIATAANENIQQQPKVVQDAIAKLAKATDQPAPQILGTERKPSPLLQAEAEPADTMKVQNATLRAPVEAPRTQKVEAGQWGVQVGAYNDRASGQRATALVADSIPELSRASAKVVSVTNGSGTIYRARLVGIGEDEARSACRKLEAKGRPCMMLPPSGGTAAWLASSN